jgi:hypothetical protein
MIAVVMAIGGCASQKKVRRKSARQQVCIPSQTLLGDINDERDHQGPIEREQQWRNDYQEPIQREFQRRRNELNIDP